MIVAEILHDNLILYDWAWVEANVTRERGVRRVDWSPGKYVIRGGFPLFDRDTGAVTHQGFDFVNSNPPYIRSIGWRPKDEDKCACDWYWADPG